MKNYVQKPHYWCWVSGFWITVSHNIDSIVFVILDRRLSFTFASKHVHNILQIIHFGIIQLIQVRRMNRNGGALMQNVRYSIWIPIRIKFVWSLKWFNWLEHFYTLQRRFVKWNFSVITCLSRIWWVANVKLHCLDNERGIRTLCNFCLGRTTKN